MPQLAAGFHTANRTENVHDLTHTAAYMAICKTAPADRASFRRSVSVQSRIAAWEGCMKGIGAGGGGGGGGGGQQT